MRYDDPDPANAEYVEEVNREFEEDLPFNNLFMKLDLVMAASRGTLSETFRRRIVNNGKSFLLYKSILYYAMSTGFDIEECSNNFKERSLLGFSSLEWPDVRPREKAKESIPLLYIYLRQQGFSRNEIIS